MEDPVKVFVLGLCLMVVSMLLCSCDGSKPRTLSKGLNVDMRVVPKDSPMMKEAVEAIKENTVVYRKDDRCFAVVLFRMSNGYCLASQTAIDSRDYR